MVVVRIFAGLFLLLALIALAFDVTRSTGFVMTPMIESWGRVAATSLTSAQAAVTKATHPLVWELMRKLLALPTWAFFGGIGMLLAYLGRRRKFVNIYAN